jgi:hypothetical protein
MNYETRRFNTMLKLRLKLKVRRYLVLCTMTIFNILYYPLL